MNEPTMTDPSDLSEKYMPFSDKSDPLVSRPKRTLNREQVRPRWGST